MIHNFLLGYEKRNLVLKIFSMFIYFLSCKIMAICTIRGLATVIRHLLIIRNVIWLGLVTIVSKQYHTIREPYTWKGARKKVTISCEEAQEFFKMRSRLSDVKTNFIGKSENF